MLLSILAAAVSLAVLPQVVRAGQQIPGRPVAAHKGMEATTAEADALSLWHASGGAGRMTVNGTELDANQRAAVEWIAGKTVPRLPGGPAERLAKAALVTWWSLKEGVLGLDNPHAYSNCDDRVREPIHQCEAGVAWQVGLAAIQVPGHTLAEVEQAAVGLYPGSTPEKVLAHTADYAGFPTGSAGHNQIVNSTGTLRVSWFLRNHRIGFTLIEPVIRDECFAGTPRPWCFGTNWDTSRSFAASQGDARRSIDDIRGLLQRLGGAEPAGTPDPATAAGTVGRTDGQGLVVRAAPGRSSAALDVLPTGTEVRISCQAAGETVTNTRGFTSDLWDYVPAHGGYLADAFMATGHDGRIPGVPDCPGRPQPPAPRQPSGTLVPVQQNQGQATEWEDCGPTSVVTAVLALGKTPHGWDPANPREAIERAREDMGLTRGVKTGGTNEAQVNAAFATYDLRTRTSWDLAEILAHVRSGRPVVLAGNTKDLPWPKNANPNGTPHFLTVAGYDNGTYLVLDPVAVTNTVQRADEATLAAYFDNDLGRAGVLG